MAVRAPALGVGEPRAGRGATQPGEHAADEQVQHGGGQRGVKGQLIAQGEGQRQDPLAHGHPGDDAIDQVGGSSLMRRPPQEGQKPRLFQESAISDSSPHLLHLSRANPWDRNPHFK